MIEAAAEATDDLLHQTLETHTLAEEDSRRLCASAPSVARSSPMLCGSAFKNKGVEAMSTRSSTTCRRQPDIPPVKATRVDDYEKIIERKADDAEPFSRAGVQDHDDPFAAR